MSNLHLSLEILVLVGAKQFFVELAEPIFWFEFSIL